MASDQQTAPESGAATTAVARRAPRRSGPTLRVERRLLRDGVRRLGSMDEVGRGSPAGPVYVGLVVIDASVGRPPLGIRDSKLLTPTRRQVLAPGVEAWAVECAVGAAEASDVDRYGVTGALRLAGRRALAQLSCPLDLVLLDGSHDWLTTPECDDPLELVAGLPSAGVPVVTRIKADLTCTSVAAASILAKVARDAVMVELAGDYPEYGWEVNKGYGTSAHFDAVRRFGPTPHHRMTWQLPPQTIGGG